MLTHPVNAISQSQNWEVSHSQNKLADHCNQFHTHAWAQRRWPTQYRQRPTKWTLRHDHTVPLEWFRNSNLVLSRDSEQVLHTLLKPCDLEVQGDTINTADLGPHCTLGITTLNDVSGEINATIIFGWFPVKDDRVCGDVWYFQGTLGSCGNVWGRQKIWHVPGLPELFYRKANMFQISKNSSIKDVTCLRSPWGVVGMSGADRRYHMFQASHKSSTDKLTCTRSPRTLLQKL